MAFGQSSGPPATGKQVRELLELLAAAGHTDFRDARGPMGFTQRQAGGRFTRDEAEAFIERLESEAHRDGDEPPGGTRPPDPNRSVSLRPSKIPVRPPMSSSSEGPTRDAIDLAVVPGALLAAELQRRGWIVVEP